MLNRRLVILFVLFIVAFGALAVRLANLQITETEHWQKEMRDYVHHPIKIETARGAILDRNHVPLAYDDACYDLAIDYRAMNLDDRWITDEAIARLKGETFPNRVARLRRIAEIKAQVAEQIEAIPTAIARLCDTSMLPEPSPGASPVDKVRARFQGIRQSIHILRQDLWTHRFKKGEEQGHTEDDAQLDARFHDLLSDEVTTHTIIPHISNRIAFDFREHADEYPGLVVVESRTRVYPYRTIACHVLGTLRPIEADTETLKNHPFKWPDLLSDKDSGDLLGYLPGDRIGESGAERILEPLLRGRRGCRLVELGMPARAIPSPATIPATADDSAAPSDRRIDPVPGNDVCLTIDIALQKDIEDALNDPARSLLKGHDGKDHFVTMVVLRLDGDVLAMISNPGYDPNTIDDARGILNHDEYRRPLSNRALQPYQPGSTVKPFIASAALTEKLITPETTIVCNGYLFRDRPDAFRCSEWVSSRTVHGPLQLPDAIAKSCNIYFYTVAGKLGIERLSTWFSNFGLGRDSGFELPEANGSIPHARATADPDLVRNESFLLGIGQGPITITPLQMANAYATLLRGGHVIAPRLLADAPAKELQAFELSPATLTAVKEGMQRVITNGTGKTAFRGFRLPLGGKTGTADTHRPAFDADGRPLFDRDRPLRNPDGSPKLGADKQPLFARASEEGTDAWFVGYAPADRPKFVVAAVMEFGGHGGAYAAPMVKEALIQLERHDYLPRMDVP